MNEIVNLSRRRFVQSSLLAGGGFILGFHLPEGAEAQQPPAGAAPQLARLAPNAFVRIGADESVLVIANHAEMGQGCFTSLAMLLAEELDADWSRVRAEHAPVEQAYGNMFTAGSSTTHSEFDRFRRYGAVARAMLVTAAAQAWEVEPATCRTENGRVMHAETNRSFTYGQLVERAARLTPPAANQVTLKNPQNFRLIGTPVKRLDTPAKSDGTGVFGIDVKVPGMLVALVARSPVFGGRVANFNADAARAVPGVRHVVQIDRGIAVVADGFFAAKNGRAALDITWNEGPQANLNSTAQREQYAALAQTPGTNPRRVGDAAAALGRAARRLEASYKLPYLAHAPMEPMNCVADVRADSAEIWMGTQAPTADRNAAAQAAGLQPNQVRLHTTLLGGSFGRRALLDGHVVREAVQISRAVRAPVKVIWTREDDMTGGYYRPVSHHALAAGLDDNNNPIAWTHRVVAGNPGGGAEGATNMPYNIPNSLVDSKVGPGGVPTLWWRSVANSYTIFAVESFIDELAHAAGRDPYEFRRGLLGDNHPRHKAVLELAAARAGWGTPLPAGRARGIALVAAFRSFVANVAEVSITPAGEVKVHRVVCAIDCGPVVNPDTVKAQMESGIVFGLSAALHGEITLENGRAVQTNFHQYPILRMNETPVMEVHIVPSTAPMGGTGEPGVPCIAPAVGNAIYALTRKRVRRLPIRAADLEDA
jgi:isoquinoline 1-oxidoreductase beta subunit